MSWLEERKLIAVFNCHFCGNNSEFAYSPKDWPNDERRPLIVPCACGKDATEYIRTLPYRVGGCVKELFEQNGRLGLRIRDTSGNVSYRSLTKENYLNTGDTTSKLTTGYQEHVDKQAALASRHYEQHRANRERLLIDTLKSGDT